MTHADELRRPIRVLPPAEVAEAPTPPRPPAPATVQAADRFRRTLAGPRRAEAAPEKPGTAPEPRAERGGDTGARIPRSALALLALDDDEDAPDLRPTDALREAHDSGAAAAGDADLSQDAPATPSADQAATGVLRIGAAGGWAEDTAKMIATLCTRADPAFVNWTVTVPMDAETLPDTDLVLSMSPHWLSLRFRTQSPLSSQLIGTHKQRLQVLLERTGGLPHGIDIEVV